MAREHPLQRFWIEESGWYNRAESPIPDLGKSEGKLCIDSWNAAVLLALKCVVPDGDDAIARRKIEDLYYNGPTY